MKPEDIVTLSFYKELSSFKDNDAVSLVQHIDTQVLYVKKTLPARSKSLYLMLQRMDIPGTPKVHHILDSDDTVIIIEEYISGRTLETLLSEKHIFSEADTINIALQLCNTLLMLHNAETPIIHRDIKPSNIIISGELKATLIDFDASKLYDSNKNHDTVLMGTVDYAAPEQFGFSQSDARTDIYALGVLMNKMLTGFFPKDLMYQGRLSSIIKKCIHMDPDERYDSISALIKVLQKHSIRVDKELHRSSDDSNKTGWTLPGFRSNTAWKKILAVLGYVILVWFASVSEFENATPVNTIMNRLSIVLWGFTVIALFTNYRNFAGKLPLSKSKNPFIKYLGCLLWSFIALILALLLPDTIYSWFDY